jgi:hypothetical protein
MHFPYTFILALQIAHHTKLPNNDMAINKIVCKSSFPETFLHDLKTIYTQYQLKRNETYCKQQMHNTYRDQLATFRRNESATNNRRALQRLEYKHYRKEITH